MAAVHPDTVHQHAGKPFLFAADTMGSDGVRAARSADEPLRSRLEARGIYPVYRVALVRQWCSAYRMPTLQNHQGIPELHGGRMAVPAARTVRTKERARRRARDPDRQMLRSWRSGTAPGACRSTGAGAGAFSVLSGVNIAGGRERMAGAGGTVRPVDAVERWRRDMITAGSISKPAVLVCTRGTNF